MALLSPAITPNTTLLGPQKQRIIKLPMPQNLFLRHQSQQQPPCSHNISLTSFVGTSHQFHSLSCSNSITAETMSKPNKESETKAVKVKAIEATPESFKEYGQVIEPIPDSVDFGPLDAQLDLSRGIPRFYIMQLRDRELKFHTITHHASVTQCLGSVGSHVWYLGVAKPTIADSNEKVGDSKEKITRSPCGHLYVPPSVEEVRVFRIQGSKYLKLNAGTWHAGPLFLPESMDFYNLELSNTNVVDHTTHDFSKEDGVCFVIDE